MHGQLFILVRNLAQTSYACQNRYNVKTHINPNLGVVVMNTIQNLLHLHTNRVLRKTPACDGRLDATVSYKSLRYRTSCTKIATVAALYGAMTLVV